MSPLWLVTLLSCYLLGGAYAATARALIYSATADYRHDSIPTAIQAMEAQASKYNIQFDNNENTTFTDEALSVYDILVFLDNTAEGTTGTLHTP